MSECSRAGVYSRISSTGAPWSGGVRPSASDEPAAQLGGECGARCERDGRFRERLERVRRHRGFPRGSRHEMPAGRARATPRSRARFGRDGRRRRERRGRRGSEGSARPDGAHRARSSTACTRARSNRSFGLFVVVARRPVTRGAGTCRRSSRSSRRQWSTSLLRATVMSHATVRSGTALRFTASAAARKVSDVRSSATAGSTFARSGSRRPGAAPARTSTSSRAPVAADAGSVLLTSPSSLREPRLRRVGARRNPTYRRIRRNAGGTAWSISRAGRCRRRCGDRCPTARSTGSWWCHRTSTTPRSAPRTCCAATRDRPS